MGRALHLDPSSRWDATWLMERFEEINDLASIDTDKLLANVLYAPEEEIKLRRFNEGLGQPFFDLIQAENHDGQGAAEIVRAGKEAYACIRLYKMGCLEWLRET
ncbi:MAG TPA: hypothetical protein VGL56_19650 [Fimbriimonadaceae bacterium]|jgi:hypothetical protein